MKIETKSFAEYKAPRCKCVEVHVNHVLCGSLDGIDNIEDDDVQDQTNNWGL